MFFFILNISSIFTQSTGNISVKEGISEIESSINSEKLVIQNPDLAKPMELEKNLAIKTISSFVTDNADGIYANILKKELEKYFIGNKRFKLISVEASKTSMELFGDQALKKVAQISTTSDIDGVLHIRVIKNKNQLKLDAVLYIAKTQERYIQEMALLDISNNPKDDFIKFKDFFDRVFSRLPYMGLITSRFDDKVTIDIGLKHGLREGVHLPVYRISRVAKHPLLGTFISVTRVRIGTITLFKVDEWMSFATVTEESVNYKILDSHKIMKDSLDDNATLVLNEVKIDSSQTFKNISEQQNKKLQDTSLITNEDDTVLGHITPMVRFMHFSYSVLGSNNQLYKSTAKFSPGFGFDAELFLTKNWFAQMFYMYQIHSFTPYGGVSNSFNSSFTDLFFTAGYKHYIDDVVVGFKAGFKKTTFFTDATPVDTLHTNKRFKGFYTGLFADIPIDNKLIIGFSAHLVFFNRLSEAPNRTAATYNNSIFGFSLKGSYRMHKLYSLVFGFMYDIYRTSYSGTGFTSVSSLSSSISNKGVYTGVRFDF